MITICFLALCVFCIGCLFAYCLFPALVPILATLVAVLLALTPFILVVGIAVAIVKRCSKK